MKHAPTIIITMLALLLLAACGRHRYPPGLAKVDSIASAHPDSAASMLSQMAADTATWAEDARMYYRLLRLETADRLYEMPRSDSAVLPLLRYYEQGGDRRLLPRAYYTAGRVYAEMKDAQQAAKYFRLVLETAKGDDKSLIKSRAYSRIGYMFAESELYDDALDMFMRSYNITSQSRDTTNMIYDLRDIARTYADKNIIDSALNTYNKALKLAIKQGNKKMEASANTQIAALYEKEGQYALAWRHLRPAISYNNPHERNAMLAIAARLFSKEDKLDSAVICYNALAEKGNSFGKHAAHTWLAEHYSNTGDTRKAAHHLKLSKQYADSVNLKRAASAVNLEVALYDNNSLKNENQKQHNIIIAMTICFICIVSIYFARPILKERVTMNKGTHKNTATETESKGASHTTNGNHKINVVTSNDGKQHLPITPPAANIDLDTLKKEQKNKIKESRIYNEIRKKLDQTGQPQPLSDEEWEELASTVDTIYTDFRKRLYELCDMSVADYHVCLLLKINLKLREIASLTCLSYQGLASVRIKLYMRAFKEKGEAKAWDKVILEL